MYFEPDSILLNNVKKDNDYRAPGNAGLNHRSEEEQRRYLNGGDP